MDETRYFIRPRGAVVSLARELLRRPIPARLALPPAADVFRFVPRTTVTGRPIGLVETRPDFAVSVPGAWWMDPASGAITDDPAATRVLAAELARLAG